MLESSRYSCRDYETQSRKQFTNIVYDAKSLVKVSVILHATSLCWFAYSLHSSRLAAYNVGGDASLDSRPFESTV